MAASLMQQNRKVDLKDVFCYQLGHVLWATSDGKLMKTSKSQLMLQLEKVVTTADSVPYPLFPYLMEWP